MNNLATTETVCFLGICFDDPKINFNTESFALSDDELCSVTLHELMHTLGEGYEAGHDDGTDEVYSCSRYCAGCVDVANGAPHSSNVDCGRCADTVDRKMECGYKQNLVEGGCGEFGDGLCHDVLSCPLGRCESCMTLQTELCDTSPLGVSSFVCCAACPSDCNQSMDMPCGAPPEQKNTCSQPPPFCR